jgi:hypothetical protein
VLPDTATNSSSSSSSGSGGSSGGSSSSQQRVRTGYDRIQLPSSAPSSMLKVCSFSGVPAAFPAQRSVESHSKVSSCAGGLVPAALEQVPLQSGGSIYVDAALMADAAFVARMQALQDLGDRLLYASQLLQLLRRNIVQALELDTSSSGAAVRDDAAVPIVMVICNDLLGFTQQGAVYMNVAPVLWHTGSVQDLCEALFHTILHELAHRTHQQHDTYFADELARLVLRCAGCLRDACFQDYQSTDQMTTLCSGLAPLHS